MIRKEFLYLGWYLLLSIPIIIIFINFSIKAKKEWLSLIGQIRPEARSDQQRREYIRLESAFPVEFRKVEEAEEKEYDIHQGFTKDVSREGMSIESIVVRGKKFEDLVPGETKLNLIINIPSEPNAISALATVRWVSKIEAMSVDRYLIGVSYDDIAEPDLEKIVKYALWFRRRPDIFAIMVAVVIILLAAFVSTTLIFKNKSSELERRVEALNEEKARLTKEAVVVRKEKEVLSIDLEELSKKYAMLLERSKILERESKRQEERLVEEEKLKTALESKLKEPPVVKEEAAPEIEAEEMAFEEREIPEEPIVEIRIPAKTEDEIVVEPNITRGMIEGERDVYNTFRDYILKEEVQLLDRYASLHRTSIYHAAGLFALAELRYKNRHIKEMTIKAYRDVIILYPRSKYASYASHRLDQITRNLPYETYALRYFYIEYNLPPLFDYRELEPYKK